MGWLGRTGVAAWYVMWLLVCAPVAAATKGNGTLGGTVTDPLGASLAGVDVAVGTPAGTTLFATETDADGGFRFDALAPTTYVLTAVRDGYARTRALVRLASGQSLEIRLRLDLQVAGETVTVTPVRGDVMRIDGVPEFVSVTDAARLSRRSYLTLPQALREEAGVHVQQTTTSQGSPFVRGLTGQYVVNLIEGVRFNTATFRPGANQYTALIEPFFVGQVELVRGPASTQYGSDALGGTVNVVMTPFGRGAPAGRFHGRMAVSAGTADRSAGGGGDVAFGGARWGATFGAVGRAAGDLRPGGGIDSHSVVTRLLGVSSRALGSRLAQTAYSQYGANARFVVLPSTADVLTVTYLRGAQQHASRYDQLDGGAGNLISRFDPQVLDFALARYERMRVGPIGTLSVTASYNGQRDDRTSQGINNAKLGLRSKITEEANRTDAYGVQMVANSEIGSRQRLAFGAEMYNEHVTSRRTEFSYVASSALFSNAADVRARFPDGARYRTLAAFAQDTVAVVPERLSAVVGARYSAFRYAQRSDDNPVLASGPTVPDFVTSVGDLTWNAGLVWAATPHVSVTARAARGFRAPNVNDFGAIGLSGLGFEISPDEALRAGARAARLGALEASVPLEALQPEQVHSYELGLKLASPAMSATVSAFHSQIGSFIERRAVVMSPEADGAVLGGQPIIRQGAAGEVYTALASSPVIVRANGGRVRLQGVEGLLTLRLPRHMQVDGNLAYVRGTDRETGRPPELENGIPPAHGYIGMSWMPPERRWWAEVYTLFAFAQHRFSANDLSQARMGGLTTSQEIRDFFANGAAARGLVHDGILLATGETVEQVIRRVIGPDPSARVALFTSNPGYAVIGVRGAWRVSPHGTVTVIVENLLDRNYRTMGSGVDGPGAGMVAKYGFTF